jgi:hypothetical protein
MIPLHEAAQNVAWFTVLMYVFIGVVLARDIRKEKRDERKGEQRNR